MISFKQFLSEGGNLRLGDEAAHQIDLKTHSRDEITKDIWTSLELINKHFKKSIGMPLWSDSTFSSKVFLSGSSKHFFDSSIDTTTFVSKKKQVGDIDTMIDINAKDLIKSELDKLSGQFGEMKFIGYKESADQFITLWKLPKYGINIQLDLEQVEFKNGSPTTWSIFSHSSSWDDMSEGIKGAMHKKLLSALNAKNLVDMVLQMKTKTKEITAAPHTFSIKGFREKYRKQDDGKFVEIKDSQYDRDLKSVFRKIFGKDPVGNEADKFWSFVGTAELINKHMNTAEKQKVIDGFVFGLFGPTAQGLYVGNPERDLEEKMMAINYLTKAIKTKYNNTKLVEYQQSFYKNYK